MPAFSVAHYDSSLSRFPRLALINAVGSRKSGRRDKLCRPRARAPNLPEIIQRSAVNPQLIYSSLISRL